MLFLRFFIDGQSLCPHLTYFVRKKINLKVDCVVAAYALARKWRLSWKF